MPGLAQGKLQGFLDAHHGGQREGPGSGQCLFQSGEADLGLIGEVLAGKTAPGQFLADLGANHFILFGGKVVVTHGGRNIPHIPAHFHLPLAESAGRSTFFTLAKQA